MDPDVKTLLETNHLSICRLCLKRDGIKDILSVYCDSGITEAYNEILNFTFKIQISSAPNQSSPICDSCITRLQDGHNFKQMILKNQEIFQEFVNNIQYEHDIKLSEAELKLEMANFQEETYSQMLGDDSLDDNECLSNIKQELKNNETKPILRKKRTKIKYKTKMKVDNDESNQQKDWTKISERRGSGPLLRENSLQLIANSTICVFQWNKSRYRCFCCKEPFADMDMLKEHTRNSHSLRNIEKNIIKQQNRLVKVEISNVECKLCREKLESLSSLKEHLVGTHGSGIGDHLLVPFRIENELKCQICSESFTQFRLLNIHMNKHYQRQTCHICGAGFSNLVFLNLHKSRAHRQMVCKMCNMNFSRRTDKRNHDVNVHGLKLERKLRFPCPFCSQRFFQENLKIMHLVECHGMEKPEFRCSVCPKVFITRSLCNNHVKNVHNKEKSHECDVCHNYFYTKSDVVRHKFTHSGEKRYSCPVCSNSFASKDSLRRHEKRTHVGVIKSGFE